MSSAAEQICILFKQGNSPEQISEMLGHELINVLLILNSAGHLTKKKLERNMKANVGNISTPNDKVGGAPSNSNGGKDSVTVNIDQQPDDIVIETFNSPEEVYKRYQIQIARKLCATALSDADELTPAGVIAKVQIYCNEEASGRNEARAKRSDSPALLNIAQLLMQAQLADAKVNKALGINATEAIIVSETSNKQSAEKVA
jgi:hypothetical protein